MKEKKRHIIFKETTIKTIPMFNSETMKPEYNGMMYLK